MSAERTLSIIKPDAVRKNIIGLICSRFEKENLRIIAAKMQRLSKQEAGEFYVIHKERPFYDSLISFMSSGPIFVQVLAGDNAVKINRRIMGATDPRKAEIGTIRADFADSIEMNAVHGSDSQRSAKDEIDFFFSNLDLYT